MNKANEIIEGEVITKQKNNNVKRSRNNKLSYKASQFAKYYKEGNTMGNGTKSAIKAGYSEVAASAQASRLLKDVRVLDILNKNIDRAQGVISSIMDDESESGTTRLAAAREVLDRTIGKPIQRSESVSVNITVESMLESDD